MDARPSNLLPRIAAGDASAVGACLDEFGPTILALARRYLTPVKGDIEGAVQDVFVELWKSAGRFDPTRGTEAAFVMTMAHRRLIDRQRWYASRFSVGEAAMEAAPPPQTPAAEYEREEARAAAAALDALPADEQKVLRLSIYSGLSHERIAVATGLPVGTVKTRIRRGLERLRQILAQAGTDTDPQAPSPPHRTAGRGVGSVPSAGGKP